MKYLSSYFRVFFFSLIIIAPQTVSARSLSGRCRALIKYLSPPKTGRAVLFSYDGTREAETLKSFFGKSVTVTRGVVYRETVPGTRSDYQNSMTQLAWLRYGRTGTLVAERRLRAPTSTTDVPRLEGREVRGQLIAAGTNREIRLSNGVSLSLPYVELRLPDQKTIEIIMDHEPRRDAPVSFKFLRIAELLD